MKTDHYTPISLADLNAKAEMLTRLDNKYVLHASVLDQLAPVLSSNFDVLEIENKRSFGYQTCYFDTPTMCNYNNHVQGRRHRSKVRTRHYLDADICFVEVKLKTLRKVTVKKRLSHGVHDLDQLTPDALAFVSQCHDAQYGRPAPSAYAPVIKMQYNRVTLVAHDGQERLTIDRDLQFWDDTKTASIAPDMVVLETKSRFGRGQADTILRSAGFHPIGSCSKYCMGLAAIGTVSRFNKFLPAFRRLMPHINTQVRAKM